MNSVKLTLLFLTLHLNICAMLEHTHESSSIGTSRKRKLNPEQEFKIADEFNEQNKVNQNSEQKKLSKLDLVNNFRRECLNQHLPKDLSNIVLEYADINTKYSCSQTLTQIYKTYFGGEINGHTHPVLNMIQLKDGSLASCSIDYTIIIWKLKGGVCSYFHNLREHKGTVRSVIQLQNGSLASCSNDKTIKIWTLKEDGFYHCFQTLYGHSYSVKSIIQLRDSSLASCSLDRKMKIWTLREDGFYYCSLTTRVVSSDSNIIQLQDDSIVFYFGAEIRKLKEGVVNYFFLNQSADCIIQEAANGLTFCSSCSVNNISHSEYDVKSITQLKDGSLACCSRDGKIRIWKLEDGIYFLCQTIDGHKETPLDKDKLCVTQFRDGSLASCSSDKTIKIWMLKDGVYSCCQTLEGHEGSVNSIIQLQDGSLASCSDDKTIRIWQNELTRLKIPKVEDQEFQAEDQESHKIKNQRTCVIS